MPTKNERISLVTDTEEVTPVQAPPPGLILESKMLPLLEEPFPVEVRDSPSGAKPPSVMPRPQAAVLPARSPAKATAPGLPSPTATLLAPAPRAVVDLVRLPQISGPLLAPRGPSGRDAWATRPPARTGLRTGLYLGLAVLLIAGAGFVGWRQWWSVRPGHIQISATPPDAVIAVGGRPLAHASATLEEPPGTYIISVTRDGYLRTDRTIELQAGQDVVLAIALASEAGSGGKTPDGAEPLAGKPVVAAAVARRPAPGGAGAAPARAGTTRVLSRHDSPAAVRIMPEIADPDQSPQGLDRPSATAPPPPPDRAATPAPAPPTGARPSPAVAARAESSPPPMGESSGTARTISGRVAKALLAIDPNNDDYRVQLPPSLARAEMKLSAVVKLCVSDEGKVSDVKLLRPADPAVDAQIPAVLSRWRFRPLIANGRPAPFCYVLQYEIGSP